MLLFALNLLHHLRSTKLGFVTNAAKLGEEAQDKLATLCEQATQLLQKIFQVAEKYFPEQKN